jgi:hypothetical protein
VWVFEGECDQLDCVDGGYRDQSCSDDQPYDSVVWYTIKPGERYVILVNERGSEDYYTLSITELPPPPNHACENALGPLRTDGSLVIGTTPLQATVDEVDPCGYDAQTPSLWYKITGTGGDGMMITTCSKFTDFQTAISVYILGDCGSLYCVAAGSNMDDYTCPRGHANDSVTVAWNTVSGVEYYVMIHSASLDSHNRYGNFGLATTAFTWPEKQ